MQRPNPGGALRGTGSCRPRLSSARTPVLRAASHTDLRDRSPASRRFRAASFTARNHDERASPSSSTSCSGTDAIFAACASDTSLAGNALSVRGHADTDWTVASAVRAAPVAHPPTRARNSDGGRSTLPQSKARAAARALAVSHAFAPRAKRAASTAQSSPEYNAGSNDASASQSPSRSRPNRAHDLPEARETSRGKPGEVPACYTNTCSHAKRASGESASCPILEGLAKAVGRTRRTRPAMIFPPLRGLHSSRREELP